MNSVALLTPSYGRDLDLCKLLCESVDRHVLHFSKHFLLVPDSDMPLFAQFESDRRSVIPASAYLPRWLRPMPRIIQRKRRQFWWSLRTRPVSGWHVQQILKIAAVATLPYDRFCILDSDIVFFREYDLSRFEHPLPIPLLEVPDVVTPAQLRHARWVETSYELLNMPVTPLPASDFIGHILFWDQCATRAMLQRIEETTRTNWIEALCRTREFSEYMLYGFFVKSEPLFAEQHRPVAKTQCLSYWERPKLNRAELNALLQQADENDVAFSIASFSGTAVQTIRAVVKDHETTLAPKRSPTDTLGLNVIC